MKDMICIILNILLCISAQVYADHLVLRELHDYPLALCNDGTYASYHYTDTALDNPHMLIYLGGGGGACVSLDACQDKCKDGNAFCTADLAATYDKEETMWSQDPEENPPFHNFGKVYVHHCSSDLWSGTKNASEDTNVFYFHGKHIVDAVVKDIIKHKPAIESMEQLVLIGASAGAYGVGLNCDFVADQFHAVSMGLDVRCIADANDFYPSWVHVEGCDPYEFNEIPYQLWESEADQSCIEDSPEGSKECLMFPSYYNFIETPFMVVAHYIDTDVHGPCTPPLDQDQDFWDNWQQEAFTMALTYMEDKPQNGLFFSNCPFHVSVTMEFAWSEMDVPLVNAEGSVLYKNIVNNWLAGEGPYQAMDMPLEKNPKCPY